MSLFCQAPGACVQRCAIGNPGCRPRAPTGADDFELQVRRGDNHPGPERERFLDSLDNFDKGDVMREKTGGELALAPALRQVPDSARHEEMFRKLERSVKALSKAHVDDADTELIQSGDRWQDWQSFANWSATLRQAQMDPTGTAGCPSMPSVVPSAAEQARSSRASDSDGGVPSMPSKPLLPSRAVTSETRSPQSSDPGALLHPSLGQTSDGAIIETGALLHPSLGQTSDGDDWEMLEQVLRTAEPAQLQRLMKLLVEHGVAPPLIPRQNAPEVDRDGSSHATNSTQTEALRANVHFGTSEILQKNHGASGMQTVHSGMQTADAGCRQGKPAANEAVITRPSCSQNEAPPRSRAHSPMGWLWSCSERDKGFYFPQILTPRKREGDTSLCA